MTGIDFEALKEKALNGKGTWVICVYSVSAESFLFKEIHSSISEEEESFGDDLG